MKIVVFLVLTTISVAYAGGPTLPTCNFPECVYLWVGNYVPSTESTQFDFFIDQTTTVATAVNYGVNTVYAVSCNSSTSQSIQLAIGVTTQGPTNSVTPSLLCGHLYAFFASRLPNINNNEQYGTVVRLMECAPGATWMSGLIFNGIYRGGENGVNAAFCDVAKPQCPTNQGTTNLQVNINTINEMQLLMSSGYENPVTITGPSGQTLFSNNVLGAVGGVQIWIFYGDNQDQSVFPLQGGVSPAYFLTISFTVLVTLVALVSLL